MFKWKILQILTKECILNQKITKFQLFPSFLCQYLLQKYEYTDLLEILSDFYLYFIIPTLNLFFKPRFPCEGLFTPSESGSKSEKIERHRKWIKEYMTNIKGKNAFQ